jgi:hypothetical protein
MSRPASFGIKALIPNGSVFHPRPSIDQVHLAFPRVKAYVSRLVTALEAAAVGHEAKRHGGVLWLRSPGA